MATRDIVMFMTGLGIGSIGAVLAVRGYYKNYYETLCNEDIQSYIEYKDAESKNNETVEVNPDKESTDETGEKKEAVDYQAIIQKLNYSEFSKSEAELEKEKEAAKKREEVDTSVENDTPYVIGPDDFANDSTFEKVTLTFFSGDEVFMTVNEEVLQSGMEMIGRENLDRFGEYESEVLYVRNELQGVDYEVILEERSYEDSEYAAGNYEAD